LAKGEFPLDTQGVGTYNPRLTLDAIRERLKGNEENISAL